MSSSDLPGLPSLRRHQLFQEFSSLKYAAPPGVYVTIAPGDPTLWSGVIFVRSGPYSSAVLRFQIRFPPSYPDLPPLVTFFTDVFHPLIVPLTTYTFSTNASTEDPISASDQERLPPGGFSLRHGFPHWFGQAKKSDINSATSSRTVSHSGSATATGKTSTDTSTENPSNDAAQPSPPPTSQPQDEGTDGDTDRKQVVTAPTGDQLLGHRKTVPVSVLLNYIRSTFDDEAVLDSVPLTAAGNPGAWHAWRAHRQDDSTFALRSALKKGSPHARQPGDWHWDGIWAKRVRTEIEASHSDQILFGGAARGGDETIRFSRLDEDSLSSIKEMMIPQIDETHE